MKGPSGGGKVWEREAGRAGRLIGRSEVNGNGRCCESGVLLVLWIEGDQSIGRNGIAETVRPNHLAEDGNSGGITAGTLSRKSVCGITFPFGR